MFIISSKSETYYFKKFIEMVDISIQIATKLNEILQNYDKSDFASQMQSLHKLENKGDELRHELIEKIAKEFITPIEREDIMALAGEIDDVTDAVEDILLKMYMFNIKVVSEEAIEFGKLIEKCCKHLHLILQEFENYKKSKTIKSLIIELNHLEEEGDRLYISSVRKLFTSNLEPTQIMAWNEVYSCFEKCCDMCEHVADQVENVVLKNS